MVIVAIIVAIALVGTAAYVFVLAPSLKASISPSPVEVDAGAAIDLSVTVKSRGSTVAADSEDVEYLWSVDPASMGTFDRRATATVTFTAAVVGGEGTISCEVTYKGDSVTAKADLTVRPPVLDAIVVDPPSKTLSVGQRWNFTARAISSVAIEIPGVSFDWSVSGMATGEYTLSSTTGSTVEFTGNIEGTAVLTATGTYNGVTKSGTSSIEVGVEYVRTVSYVYYDLLNVPFGEHYSMRWKTYHDEQVISNEYPYLFYWYSAPPGNIWIYGNMRLNITGRNLTSINMNEWPEFLPLLGTARGGNAEIHWWMQYLTSEQMERYPENTASWADGWVIGLNGTVTMDRQAAMAVLNVTSAGFDDFDTWWTQNERSVEDKYASWLLNEGNKRLDIYNMYEYVLTLLTFNLTAEKVGDKVVLTLDTVSWGMEALMTRWFHEAFMPVEHYMEGMNFRAKIGPERADIDVSTAIEYGIYAYESTVVPGGATHGDPVWVFETYPQDYVESSVGHPKSDFDPYVPFDYLNTAPGSKWYNKTMPYDYAPGAFNLSGNETLKIEWPAHKPTVFKAQKYYENGTPVLDPPSINDRVLNVTDYVVCRYSEPMMSDNQEVTPGTISIDNATGTVLFTGPIDMWSWSKNQTKHEWLANEWDRMGIIPYGIPYVEFGMVNATVPLPHADHFEITGMPSSVPAGDPVTFTVTVYDQFGDVYTGYVGTVNFTSSDPAAALPGNTTFVAGDNGVHTFTNLTFWTVGTQSLTVVDIDDRTITGQATGIEVTEQRKADHFVLSEVSIPSVVNEAQNITVTVYDQYGALFTGYAGTVSFGTNRSGEVVLPGPTPFTVGVDHIRIEYGVTFTSDGWFLIYCNDTVDDKISGELSVPAVAAPSQIDHFELRGETRLQPYEYYDLEVIAYDQYGFVYTGYRGTVTFSTDAPAGTYTLPSDTQFEASDMGTKLFPGGMKFTETGGPYTVTVSDTIVTTATGTLEVEVLVMPRIVYTAYDFFEEPFGEWFWNPAWRPGRYYQDWILSNEIGKHTWLYDPGQNNSHGVIMAPYRWSMTATNVTNVDVHHPEFMPTNTTVGPQAGAEAELHIRFQYLDHEWWNDYWVPVWGPWGGLPFTRWLNNNDGYGIGTVITVTMNREAAYEWIGLPVTEPDPLSWWNSYNGTYIDEIWVPWIDNEGNSRLDIFSGYADFYYPEHAFGMMQVVDGKIVLTIAHVNWGYEVLMTRWLSESGLCIHEPYMEDFDLHATLGNGIANVTFDAVAQYNFHAVMANGTAGDGAWVWEPTRIDYVPSWYGFPKEHPSDYDPYAYDPFMNAYTLYQSWNSGDEAFGTGVSYDATPQWFNLSEYQTLVIKLPQGSDVICYQGVGVGPQAMENASAGDLHDYDAITYYGEASLGYMVTNPANPLDPAEIYDPATKTLTIRGPYDFDNRGGRGTILYHGAPWIEFNVAMTAGAQSAAGSSVPELSGEASAGSAVSAEMSSLVVAVSAVMLSIVALAVTAKRWEC
ncbi:MAG: Ig-like domain-containing protein [Thermoplasmata archaeon]